jgi:dihydroorotate dehydrogenase
MGCYFRNAVGLAAGMDKDGKYLRGLLGLGFGHIEVGTVTLRAQPGNPPPRLRREVAQECLFNRMGFNNRGLEHLQARLSDRRLVQLLKAYDTRLGISIGINANTRKSQVVEELCETYKGVYPYADYIAINFSSPNTKGLRDYQNSKDLQQILRSLRTVREQLKLLKPRPVPLVVKLSPDQSEQDLLALVPVLRRYAEGVIFSNTMACKRLLKPSLFSKPVVYSGGLSGHALKEVSLAKTKILAQKLSPLPLIACGGIDSASVACERIAMGARLVQIYTGLIYKGPGLVPRIACAIG